MLKPGDFVIVSQGRSRLLRAAELDDHTRAFLATLVEQSAPRDEAIERVLDAMSARPAERWTLEALAKIAGLSRTPFARRFLEYVGAPPIEHLTALRMQLAAAALHGSDATLAAIAANVGYVSEFAFAKAFKRHFGTAPGTFRRMDSVRAAA